MYYILRTSILNVPREQQSYHDGHLTLTIRAAQIEPEGLVENKDFVLVEKHEPHISIRCCSECGIACLPTSENLCCSCYMKKRFAHKDYQAILRMTTKVPYPDNLIWALYRNFTSNEMPPPYSDECRKMVTQALTKLSLEHRHILLRHFKRRASVSNIAFEMRIPQTKVQGIVFAALHELRKHTFLFDDEMRLESGRETVDNSFDIATLGFSNRLRNALCRGGVFSLKQLCSMTREELSSIPNLGSGCLNEIERKLAERGLALNAANPPSTEETEELILKPIKTDGEKSKSISGPYSYAADRHNCEIGKLPIRDMTYAALRRNGISTVNELCSLSIKDIKKMYGMGTLRVNDLLQALERDGLKLRS